MAYFIYALIASSFVLNAIAGIVLLRKPAKKKPQLDTSAKDLLHDLTQRGTAVLRVEVIDADALFMRVNR